MKTVVDAVFEMIADDEGVVDDGRGRGRGGYDTIQELSHHPQPPNSEAK